MTEGPAWQVMRLSQGTDPQSGGIVAGQRLSLAINGRERTLERRLVPFSIHGGRPAAGDVPAVLGPVAIVGLGYVGLSTALALLGRAAQITGYDISEDRLRAIESGDVDLSDLDRVRLAQARDDASFRLTTDSATLTESAKLLDFNPRLGAQFRLFCDSAGVDVVVAAHLDPTDRTIPRGSPDLNRSFLVEN